MTKLKYLFKVSRKHFAIPYVIFLLVFVLVPLVMLFVNGFLDPDTGRLTFNHFIEFFVEPYGLLSLLKSMLLGLITTVICLVIGYPIAYILSNPRFNKSAVLIFLFILPMWINFLLRTIALKLLLEWLSIELGYGTIVIGMVYDFLPFMILPIYTTLSNIDKSLIEASEDLGAKPHQVFIKTVLPLSVPGIVSGAMMVFMPTISTFVISDMMSNGKITMFGSFINRFFENTYQIELGSAFSIILLIAIGASVFISKKFTKNEPLAAGGGLW